MKRGAGTPTIVYSYGARKPETRADEVREQIYLAHRYKNTLVGIERNRREAVNAELNRLFPAIAETTTACAAIEVELESLRMTVKKRNAEARSKTATKEDREAAKVLRERRSTLYDGLKAAKAEAFASPQWKASQEAIEKSANTTIKAARAACGVHWGSYLEVEQAAQSFRQGKPPAFRRFRGDGVLAAHIQGGIDVPELYDRSAGQVTIEGYDPGVDRKQRASVNFRIGKEPDSNRGTFAKVPVTFHRALPDDARVKKVLYSQKRVGTHDIRRVNFVIQRDRGFEKSDRATRGVVAIDLGWRGVKAGLRVAYWIGNDGREGELILSERLVGQFKQPDEIRSVRDLKFNEVLPPFRAWIKARTDLPDWMKDRTKTIHAWRAPAQLAALSIHWRQNRFDGDSQAFTEIENWRQADKILFDREAFTRRKAQAHRKCIYATFAAQMRREYRTAIIEDVSWASMLKHAEPEDDDGKPKVIGDHRIASPGMIEEILNRSMREVVTKDAKNVTRTCHSCGLLSDEEKPVNLIHTCVKCGAVYDQDWNACMNLLGASTPEMTTV